MENTFTQDTLSLTVAATRLRLGYWAARSLVLRGELLAHRDAHGRYLVDALSLERLERDRAVAADLDHYYQTRVRS